MAADNNPTRGWTTSEDRYRMLVEQSPDGIAIYDLQGQILEVNTRAYEMLGCTREELLACKVTDIIAPEDLERQPMRYEALMSGEPVTGERVLVRKDGSRMPVEISTRLLSDRTIQVVVRDITQRKKLEEEIRHARDFYLTQLEDFPALIWRAGTDGSWDYVNRTWLQFTGRTIQQELGYGWAEGVHPEDHDRTIETYHAYFRNQQPFYIEYRLRRHDGEYRWVSDSGKPFFGNEGTFGGYLGVCYDITDQKLAHQETWQLNIDLEERVAERTRQLESINHELRAEIAERQRAEEALRITQAQLQRLVESNIIGILVADFVGNIHFANDALLKMLGYTREEARAGMLNWTEMTPPEMLARDAEAIAELNQSGVCQPYEKAFKHKDGTPVPVLIGSARLEGSSNIAVAYIVDISERKTLEERLRVREREFATLVENSPDIIFRLDRDFRLTYLNRAIQEYTEISTQSLVGKTYEELTRDAPPERIDLLPAAYREAMATKQETSFESESGGRWFRSRLVPEFAPDGSVESIIGITEEITARKNAEHDLARSEERYRSLVEAISDAVWITDSNGALTTPQLSWEAYTGQPWKEHKGDGWLQMVHPDDREDLHHLWTEAVEQKSIYRATTRLWHSATSEYRYIMVRAIPLFDEQGGVREWIGTVSDVHDRRRASEERERLLASEKAARLEAEDAVHARDELLAIVSHDLKNPLTAIKGYSQLMRRRLALLDTPYNGKLEQVIERIDESSNKMNQLLSDLLDFGRLQAGQQLSLQRRPTNLVELARTIAAEFRRTTSNHRIIVDTADDTLVGRWDSTRIEQVLGNLMSNAIKYSPDGGTITIRLWCEDTEGGRVRALSQEQPAEWAVLEVNDEGMGISETEMPHIFEWYRRAKNVSGRISGAGIGLASAKYIIDQHGGDIAVTSRRGTGSTFTVRLPM